MRNLIGALVTVALPAIAAAHPGHGAGGGTDTLWHYLFEPVHGAVALLATVACVSLAVRRGWLG